MILYASATNGRRNLTALRQCGFRLLYTPEAHHNWKDGWEYALDNGAWYAHKNATNWDEQAFKRAVAIKGAGADWVCAPDIVAGGLESLSLSLLWLPYLRARCRRVLVPVQDGMIPSMLPTLPDDVGIAIGGSTEWKEQQLARRVWSASWLHCLRVNTLRRVRLARHAGCTSSDGTGATRFSKHAQLMRKWVDQGELWGS